jgi:hypothetical protein
MSDLTSYRNQVTEYGKRAGEAEKAEKYEEAYQLYMSALDVFQHMIKCKDNPNCLLAYLLTFMTDEKNPQMVKVYKEKML